VLAGEDCEDEKDSTSGNNNKNRTARRVLANRLNCRLNRSPKANDPPQVYDGATLLDGKREPGILDCTRIAHLCSNFETVRDWPEGWIWLLAMSEG
jgi:hypothetical protein